MFMDVDALIYTCQLESSYLKGYYKKSKKALCLSQGIMRAFVNKNLSHSANKKLSQF
jgi:hypothetical protein